MSGQPVTGYEVFARSFPNRLPELGLAIEEMLAFLERCGVDARATYDVNLAVEEMATNILKYGYDDASEHEVVLRVEVRPAVVEVVLEDDGHEFDPLAAAPPDIDLPVEERQPGGLGIALVRQFAESVRYEREGGRNRLTIAVRRD